MHGMGISQTTTDREKVKLEKEPWKTTLVSETVALELRIFCLI